MRYDTDCERDDMGVFSVNGSLPTDRCQTAVADEGDFDVRPICGDDWDDEEEGFDDDEEDDDYFADDDDDEFEDDDEDDEEVEDEEE